MKTSTKNKIAFSLVSTILMSMILVSAAGVSSPYWRPDHPLTMAAGETKVVNLNLQNMAGNEDVTFKVDITKGSNIVSIPKDTYAVKAGTSDTMVPLAIKLPSNAVGTYEVEINFQTVAANEGGSVTFGLGFPINFDVIVSGKVEPKSNVGQIILILVIIAVIALIIVFARKKQKKK